MRSSALVDEDYHSDGLRVIDKEDNHTNEPKVFIKDNFHSDESKTLPNQDYHSDDPRFLESDENNNIKIIGKHSFHKKRDIQVIKKQPNVVNQHYHSSQPLLYSSDDEKKQLSEVNQDLWGSWNYYENRENVNNTDENLKGVRISQTPQQITNNRGSRSTQNSTRQSQGKTKQKVQAINLSVRY